MTSLFLQLLLVIAIAMALTATVLAVFGTKIKNRLSLSSSYNIAACLVVASILAGTISFLAIWLALSSKNPVNYSHQDVVVDIFGVLVTVLMGWNIISVVDVKKKAEKIDSISEDLDSVISGIIGLSIHSFTLREDKEAVINSCFLSLEKVNSCINDEVKKSAVREIMRVLHQIKKSYKPSDKIQIYKDQKEHYSSILWAIDDEYKEEIKQMINDAVYSPASGEDIKFANKTLPSGYAEVDVSKINGNA